MPCFLAIVALAMSTLERNISLERARILTETGRFSEAETLCSQLLSRNKNDLPVLLLTGVIAFKRADYDDAASIYRRCLTFRPNDPFIHYDLGRVLALQGKYDGALASYDKALQLKPDFIQVIADKADVFQRRGDRDSALALLQPCFVAGTETEGMLVVLLRLAGSDKETLPPLIERSEAHLARPPLDSVSRMQLLRELGRVYDRMGQYKQAFDAFAAAHKLSPMPFNPQAFKDTIESVMAMFNRDNLRMLMRASNQSQTPIFIACMPRSGSTLVEQILHAHPEMAGVGENSWLDDTVNDLQTLIESFQPYPACIADLKRSNLDQLSQQYLDLLKSKAPSAIRVANKNLRNYAHLGMVQLLFPKARVIHIKRNRIDNCLGCYMAALTANSFPWVSNMTHMGTVWREYERIMEHWHRELDIPILDVVYEELVENTETQIRRMIDFCGVEWNDQCLRYWEVDRTVMTLSYDQVRKPIFKTAVQRYKKYEEFLGPLKAALDGQV